MKGYDKCGNGIVDPGEECDCGFEGNCKLAKEFNCCNFRTCKLKKGAQCSSGECCENCKVSFYYNIFVLHTIFSLLPKYVDYRLANVM